MPTPSGVRPLENCAVAANRADRITFPIKILALDIAERCYAYRLCAEWLLVAVLSKKFLLLNDC